MLDRVRYVQEILGREKIDAMMIMRPENRFYLTGFTGTTGIAVILRDETVFLTDFRYAEQARKQCGHCRIIEIKKSVNDSLVELLAEGGVRSIGCEGDYITLQQYDILGAKLKPVEIKALYGIIEESRLIKNPKEIENINEAVKLADEAFNHITKFLREGVTEKQISLELEFFMRKKGAEKIAFDIIVASGPRGAMPHGVASNKTLSAGELVTMDFGCVLGGYHSDITRTVSIGAPGDRQREIYSIVLEAQLAGLKAVKAGVRACDVDLAARNIIEKYGYGDYFGHSTGHGLGLCIHENPRLAKNVDTLLKPGMVVTVEPGIYLPDWGGVRIEDTVVVKESGCRILTQSPKLELINTLSI